MPKYINADELKEQMVKYGWKHPDSTVHEFVDDMPSADVRENIHGEWKEEPSIFPNNPFVRCSECGEEALLDENGVAKSNFCPNCGADMRERKEAEEKQNESDLCAEQN